MVLIEAYAARPIQRSINMKSSSSCVVFLDVMAVLGLAVCVTSLLPARPSVIAVSTLDAVNGATVKSAFFHGRYGDRSLTTPVSGHLVHVRSSGNVNDGCGDYDHDLPTHDWIALIERGTCYFTDKVLVATVKYNASGVIVYNNQPDTHHVTMNSFVSDQVYVFVTQTTGRKLVLLTDSGVHVHVNITLDLHAAGTVRLADTTSCIVFVALHVVLSTIASVDII